MNNLKIIDTNAKNALKTIKLTDSNLWMEPSTKKEDADFWVKRFKFQKVSFILAQYDTELMNEKNEKMYRKVYGLFIDMKTWEKKKDDEHKTSKS
jgi:hypothetical protein